ncbi:MAG: hypothetical protein JWM85_761 [Acidimicrobiaceae bacterium]|nr:hypothetical protein [Acidimicrobiaceae bacterium]
MDRAGVLPPCSDTLAKLAGYPLSSFAGPVAFETVIEGFDIIADAERIVRDSVRRRIPVHREDGNACAVCSESWPCRTAREILS